MSSEIEKQLEKFDLSMQKLYLQLYNYQENSSEYCFYLALLARQFYTCEKLMETERKEYRNPNAFFFVYSDIEKIRELLINKGYYPEEQMKKH